MTTKSDRNTESEWPELAKRLDDATPEEWDHAAAMSRQVGVSQYKNLAIQPIEYIMANDMKYCAANIVKYACRHHMKGGVQDVDKIIHYAELLKELQYGAS